MATRWRETINKCALWFCWLSLWLTRALNTLTRYTNLANTVYAPLARDNVFCFPISHLILKIRWETLTEISEVREQQGSVISDTSSGDRKTREEVTILPSTTHSWVWPQFLTSVDKSKPLGCSGKSKFRDNDLWGLLRSESTCINTVNKGKIYSCGCRLSLVITKQTLTDDK